ncbi:hypothetical protein Ddye_025079 [Dipteronia dyeriana]|uniref:NAC domain-containing protein n=1 Tax=Dipteronia dyeriana TaxID=168575 RepID=A0AAD9TW54_9ROSI|nr:hypothetical protein Ddye_025079 [Dipteronia dyeriana]
MESAGEPGSSFQFPPGFRFHPSDEELIVHYLQNKVNSCSIPATIMAEVDLYKHNPWELPEKALFGEQEWAAGVGYWKATATDKPIFGCSGLKRLGVKKALVFYTGRAPRGVKTDWVMNEYRLFDTTTSLKGSMRLDDWVLCRVRLKDKGMLRHTREVHDTSNTDMITDSLYKDRQLLESTVLSDQNLSPIETISSESCQGNKKGNSFEKLNSPVKGSSLDTYSKPLKRKSSEENVYETILLSNKKPNVDYRDENFPLGKACPNYYSQLQDVYPNLLDPFTDFQELNELGFAIKKLKQHLIPQ